MPRPNVASCDSKKNKTNRQVKTGLYITTLKFERSFDDCLKPFPFCINASKATDHNFFLEIFTIQSQQYKHLKKVLNIIKDNKRDTRVT